MYRIVIIGFFFILFNTQMADGQPERREHERWGVIGKGKLVTNMSNTNVIGAGRVTYPELSRFPAFEYPFNPNPEGRHIYYGNMVSFHVGGRSLDRGPEWDQSDPERHMVESGDQNHYRFYKGFHFEGFPEYIAPSQNDPVPTSDNPASWPTPSWPATYPTSDPYLSQFYPSYLTAFSTGDATPIPLMLDNQSGFPGAGPNKYSPQGLYHEGQVIADQETFTTSFSKNRLDDSQEGKLMIYTTLRGLSWSAELAEDVLFWELTVRNVGTEPIYDTYFGIKANFDFPWGTFTDFNTYSKSESFAFDQYDTDPNTGEPLMIAYGWDGDGDVEGANRGTIPYEPAKLTDESPVENVALAGVIFLQTPIDSASGNELGVTTFKAFNYNLRDDPRGVGNTRARFYTYNILNLGSPGDIDGDGIDDWTWENPYPVGFEEEYTFGDRSAMAINTGPFTLMPGQTDTLILATVMGMSRAQLFASARIANQIFKSGWLVPDAPIQPRVQPEIESRKVTIRWGGISENDSLNAIAGRQPFEGYKIYRSEDGGLTWGNRVVTDADGNVTDYIPMAQYDLDNGISGPSPVIPSFNRGSDTSLEPILAYTNETFNVSIPRYNISYTDTLKYEFVDNTVRDGFTYLYAIVAYSAGDEVPDGLRPLQNSRTSGPNVATVIPHAEASTTLDLLKLVKVVPNPYVVSNPQETAIRERMVTFTRMPDQATVRIFNVAGELIQTLYHNSATSTPPTVLKWNLRSSDNMEVAPGLYFFHLSSDVGDITGKFVIIK